VRIKRIGNHKLPLPSRATHGSVGFDLSAVEEHVIHPGQVAKIGTGFAWEIDAASDEEIPDLGIPTREFGLIRDRSPGPEQGRVVEAGIVDGDYRGEVRVFVRNHSTEPVCIMAGERFAQMVILVASVYALEEMAADKELGRTARGDKGFGHSGN
jgi:dUTP pyrophosphatase